MPQQELGGIWLLMSLRWRSNDIASGSAIAMTPTTTAAVALPTLGSVLACLVVEECRVPVDDLWNAVFGNYAACTKRCRDRSMEEYCYCCRCSGSQMPLLLGALSP